VSSVKIAYSASTAITCGASTDATYRQSTAIDNTSNLYDDVLVLAQFSTGTITGNKQQIIYCYGGVGTTYEASVTGSDANYLATTTPISLPVAYVVPTPVSNTSYAVVFSVAQFYGGALPPKWGLVVQNDGTGAITTQAFNYTGITYTVA